MKKLCLLSLFSLFIICLTGCSLFDATTNIKTTTTADNTSVVITTTKDNITTVITTTKGEQITSKVNTTTTGGCRFHMDDNNDGICDKCGTELNPQGSKLNGYYLLTYKTQSQIETQDTYLYNYLEFNDSNVNWSIVDLKGSNTQNGTYTFENDVVTVEIGIKSYAFSYDSDNDKLSFDGTINKVKTKMTFEHDGSFELGNDKGSVSFTDELFGDSIDENFYNYCPTIMFEGGNTIHIWYCSNKDDGNVTDYVAYRKGTLHSDGKWTFSEKELVLSHGSSGEWDSRHACDPSIVKGEFNYKGEKYNYLMAYLGCLTSNGNINEVGIAVSKNPNGPWIKYDNNPFAKYKDSSDYGDDGANFWGYGQPSLININKKGRVLLFYTKGIKTGTFTACEEWELSNLDEPVMINSMKVGDGGTIETLNNADFAYDPFNNRIYVIKEDHVNGWYPTDGGVNWISGSNTVYYTTLVSTSNIVGQLNNAKWAQVKIIGKSATGYDRVHNCGIVTNEYGYIFTQDYIPICYTMSNLATDYPDWGRGGQWPALHTYRIHGYIIEN